MGENYIDISIHDELGRGTKSLMGIRYRVLEENLQGGNGLSCFAKASRNRKIEGLPELLSL